MLATHGNGPFIYKPMVVILLPFLGVFGLLIGGQVMLTDAIGLQQRYHGILQQQALNQGVTLAFQSSPHVPIIDQCDAPTQQQVHILNHADADLWVWRCQFDDRLHYQVLWHH